MLLTLRMVFFVSFVCRDEGRGDQGAGVERRARARALRQRVSERSPHVPQVSRYTVASWLIKFRVSIIVIGIAIVIIIVITFCFFSRGC